MAKQQTSKRQAKSASARGKEPRLIALTRARVIAVAACGILWTLLAAPLGAALYDQLGDWWHDIRQSDTEEAVERYLDQIEDEEAWVQEPNVYDESVAYFEKHYDEMDPARPHAFPETGAQPLHIGFLATESAGWTGEPLMVAADVHAPPSLARKVSEEVGSYRVPLADKTVPRTEVLCRLPFKRTLPFAKNDRVTFIGLVLADGLATPRTGGGLKHVIYMACASMEHSLNISITPKRRPGKKPIGIVNINE